ncbi:MAG: hypothetical protein Fur0037_09190 [Planctomycetota bacterium]
MLADLVFWVLFGATLAALAAALATGLSRRRAWHVAAGPAALVLLTATVLRTENLVSRYEFPEPAISIHLALALVGAVLAGLSAVTGLLLAANERWRPAHRIVVFSFTAVALLATSTGIFAFASAVPR